MPIFFARKFGRVFPLFYKKSLIGTEFDSNIGQYGAQGPDFYVVARMNWAPELPVEEILSEYYAGFGPAEPQIRKYFKLWEEVSDHATDNMCSESKVGALGAEVSGWNRFYLSANNIFTPKVMAKGNKILNDAIEVVKSQPLFLARVQFLQKGLKHAELTLATQCAYEQYEKDKNLTNFAKAVRALGDYRASIENENVANMAYLAYAENDVWSRSSLAFASQPGDMLSTKWSFMWDVNDNGINQKWFTTDFDDSKWFDIGTDSCWEEQSIGKQWEIQHGTQYDGVAWYRNTFTVSASNNKKIQLLFGAVDEACKIWINGQFVLDRPFPYKGDHESWQKSFEVDITKYVFFDRPNVLAVRVEDSSGAGGIWRPVKLLISDAK
jgi:hypothetical protein